MHASELQQQEFAVLRAFLKEKLKGDPGAPKSLIQRVFVRLMDLSADRTSRGAEQRRVAGLAKAFDVEDRQIRHALKQIRRRSSEYFSTPGEGDRWPIRFVVRTRDPGRPSDAEVADLNTFVFRPNCQQGWAMRRFLGPLLTAGDDGVAAPTTLVHSETLEFFDNEKRCFLWLSRVNETRDLDANDPIDAAILGGIASGRLQRRRRRGFASEIALEESIAGSIEAGGGVVRRKAGWEVRDGAENERTHVVLFGGKGTNPAMRDFVPARELSLARPEDGPTEDGESHTAHVLVTRVTIPGRLTITSIEADHPAGFTALHEILLSNARFEWLSSRLWLGPFDPLPPRFQFALSVRVNTLHDPVPGSAAVAEHLGFANTARKAAVKESAKVVEIPQDPKQTRA